MDEQQAIRAVVARYEAAWNRHDMDAWGALFTDDVDYVNRGGGLWRGNKANVDGHKAIHEDLRAQKQQMTWAAAVENVSFIKPDVALVHVSWKWPGFVLSSGQPSPDLRGMITMVMVKRDGAWLIRALQNTVADAVPTPAPRQ